jgi:hypothetical protein
MGLDVVEVRQVSGVDPAVEPNGDDVTHGG